MGYSKYFEDNNEIYLDRQRDKEEKTKKFNKKSNKKLQSKSKNNILKSTISVSANRCENSDFVFEYTERDLDSNFQCTKNITIIKYKSNNTDIKIPNVIDGKMVTAIGDKAFSGCKSLKTVIIPDTITSIGKNAFSDCTNLEKILIPKSVKKR